MTSILETRNVSYSYRDGIEALKEVSISLEKGRKFALVGPNGAGKSTLMLMFNGTLRPTSGEVLFHGRPLKYDSASLHEIRRKVGMVFQNSDDQIFAPTVYQDVAFGPTNLGYPKDKVERYVGYSLAYVGLMGYERRPPHHLSGGEKKRVALAGILAMEPEIMILDEPTSNLDPASSEEIMDMLDELNCGGKTIIISTHDVELAYRWADEIILMEEGRVLRRGTGSDVFEDAELIKKTRLKPPVLVELYRELANRSLLNGSKPPRNVLELTDLIESQHRGTLSRGSFGIIHIYNVDRAGTDNIKSILEKSHINFTGAMGTNAKMLAEQARIPLDFTYGVIDKCILRALSGSSSLIMTSGGMVEHTIERIRVYSEESGSKIKVIRISSSESGTISDKQGIMSQMQTSKPMEATR
jgi:cobalt/nickel transport system ATP-binding protein